MNYVGFNPEKERQDQSPDDWVFGSTSTPCLALMPEEIRDTYLPIGEVQAGKQDTSGCATNAPNNIYEDKFNYLYSNDKLQPENKKWLEDHKYVQDGRITFSDAFNAILSGTTRVGNSLKAPIDSIHRDGLVPKKLLPLESWMMWEDYHDPKRVTQDLKYLGQEFLKRFTLNYERVDTADLATLLKTDMAVIAISAYPTPVNGEYPRTDEPFNHAVMALRRPLTNIFDSYIDSVDGDFIKKLASDYRIFDTGYRVYITAETTSEDREIQLTVFESLAKYGLLAFFADWLARFSTRVRGLFYD